MKSITQHVTFRTILVLCVPAALSPVSSSSALVIVNPSEHFITMVPAKPISPLDFYTNI